MRESYRAFSDWYGVDLDFLLFEEAREEKRLKKLKNLDSSQRNRILDLSNRKRNM